MIKLSDNILSEMEKHALRDYPFECCGLLLGNSSGSEKTIVEVAPIINARAEDERHNRFLITPKDMVRGEMYARSRGIDIIGFYHSHPDHPAEPSAFDLEHAWPFYSYIILSVAKNKPGRTTSWVLKSDRSAFDSESIVRGE